MESLSLDASKLYPTDRYTRSVCDNFRKLQEDFANKKREGLEDSAMYATQKEYAWISVKVLITSRKASYSTRIGFQIPVRIADINEDI